jgi:hypothetical protein
MHMGHKKKNTPSAWGKGERHKDSPGYQIRGEVDNLSIIAERELQLTRAPNDSN